MHFLHSSSVCVLLPIDIFSDALVSNSILTVLLQTVSPIKNVSIYRTNSIYRPALHTSVHFVSHFNLILVLCQINFFVVILFINLGLFLFSQVLFDWMSEHFSPVLVNEILVTFSSCCIMVKLYTYKYLYIYFCSKSIECRLIHMIYFLLYWL